MFKTAVITLHMHRRVKVIVIISAVILHRNIEQEKLLSLLLVLYLSNDLTVVSKVAYEHADIFRVTELIHRDESIKSHTGIYEMPIPPIGLVRVHRDRAVPLCLQRSGERELISLDI